MTHRSKQAKDRRVERTKSLVFEAFFEMVQSVRFDEIKTIHIIENAGIGKSTFYEHFSDKDDVLGQSLEGPLSAFAKALTGQGDSEQTAFILNHFWERRVFARVILQHPSRDIAQACLRRLIMEGSVEGRSSADKARARANASFLSAGFLDLLNEWLLGRLNLTTEDMIDMISNVSKRSSAHLPSCAKAD